MSQFPLQALRCRQGRGAAVQSLFFKRVEENRAARESALFEEQAVLIGISLSRDQGAWSTCECGQ